MDACKVPFGKGVERRKYQKALRQLLEVLESRLLMSGILDLDTRLSMDGKSTYSQITGALTVQNIKTAYGLGDISFGEAAGDGADQTVAIVDPYGDPQIATDLGAFDSAFSLANPSFSVINESGDESHLPDPDEDPDPIFENWESQQALDVEWTHAMAPAAKILLVEASSSSPTDLFDAVDTARNYAGVSVVVMDWGFNDRKFDFREWLGNDVGGGGFGRRGVFSTACWSSKLRISVTFTDARLISRRFSTTQTA